MRLAQQLDAFQALLSPGPCPSARRFQGGRHRRRLVVGLLVHGDEIGTLPGAIAVMEALQSGRLPFGGQLDIFLGNPAAARRGQRAVEADLNRVFIDSAPDSLERRRAIELTALLDGCDVFLDLHQTALPAAMPFFTLPWRPQEARWIRALGVGQAWVTRAPGEPFAAGTRCADEHVRQHGRIGITLELGERGFSAQTTAHVVALLTRALQLVDTLAQRGHAAIDGPKIDLYRYVYAEPCTDRDLRLRRGLINFQRVQAGEVLSAAGAPLLRAPCDGALLFPKYPLPGAPLPQNLYRIAQRMHENPAVLWG